MKIETDVVEIMGGVRHGRTLGSPVSLLVRNRDHENWRDVMSPDAQPDAARERRRLRYPRPGHHDLARIAWAVEPARLRHPLAIYIPKSESAEEALWWADVFAAIAAARGWPPHTIRCMALVESHPLAYEMEEFLFGLRHHIVGLNLGRWDYKASLIHWNLMDPAWVLPDRNTIPHDVPFFQRLRHLLVDTCHRRGALAIGGMTALYPSRTAAELNARALAVLEQDKRNEARCFMDGAWTGHPDQNEIAVAQFPAPNQIGSRPPGVERYPLDRLPQPFCQRSRDNPPVSWIL